MAEGLGIPAGEVSSPTFTLVHEYRGGRIPLFHVDLYRLESVAAEDLGLHELRAEGILVIEWPDRLDREVAGAITIQLDWVGETGRRIQIQRRPAVRH
jgi:tRNA threonylcarbamoyladenosine biosynthesis protein TsaE